MHRLALLFSTALALPQGAQAQDDYYRVEADSLACVVENLSAYLRAPGDTVFINTQGCPPSAEPSILDLLTNEAPDISFADEGGTDRFLTLTRGQLECLSSVSIPPGNAIVRLYPGDCRVEAE